MSEPAPFFVVEKLHYRYPSGALALRGVDLRIPSGAFVLVTGSSGAGKSTLLRALNGLVPHFYGGQFGGRVLVEGVDTRHHPPRALARRVGFVFQDPETSFVVQSVEEEIAFALEHERLPPRLIDRRIDEVLAALGIGGLRQRAINTLSGGEAQRVAVAAALARQVGALILDEPTSQLDPPGAAALLDALRALHRAHGLTVLLAEHRLERVADHATHLLHIDDGGAQFGVARALLADNPLRPPVTTAAARLGWQPPPLTVEEARPFAAMTRLPPRLRTVRPEGEIAIEVRGLAVAYDGRLALCGIDWSARRGVVSALFGYNGAGKSTLLKTLVGLLKASAGEIWLHGARLEPTPTAVAGKVGYVPQNPNSVFFADTLRDEMRFTLGKHGLSSDGVALLARLGLAGHADRYPRDLSGGERQRAALAVMLAAEPSVILLDEPTRGLDYAQKVLLAALLRAWADEGRAVVVATHDVEWAAGVATRAAVLDDGAVAFEGPTAEVLLSAPGFNTQLGALWHDPAYMVPGDLPDLGALPPDQGQVGPDHGTID